jgi:hypothetical protein
MGWGRGDLASAKATDEHRNACPDAVQSEEMYERYVKYPTGCANLFAMATPTSVSSASPNVDDRGTSSRQPLRRTVLVDRQRTR